MLIHTICGKKKWKSSENTNLNVLIHKLCLKSVFVRLECGKGNPDAILEQTLVTAALSKGILGLTGVMGWLDMG